MMREYPLGTFAETDDEANERYQIWKTVDPFPYIDPSLLNTADILDYIAKTGMLFPFYHDNVKSASYPFKLKGDAVYWKADGTKVNLSIAHDADAQLTLEPNSIAFLTLEPMIRLPEYIALRFNLRIDHVYKGLLLGTGPIVDPGFVGKLSIPLHNLTSNPYTFRVDEKMIWVEFTKLSRHVNWFPDRPEARLFQDEYEAFPDGPQRSVEDYLAEADRNRPVRCSIPKVLHDIQDYKTGIETTISNFKKIGVFAAVTLMVTLTIALSQLLVQVVDLLQDARNSISSYESRVMRLEMLLLEEDQGVLRWSAIPDDNTSDTDSLFEDRDSTDVQ